MTDVPIPTPTSGGDPARTPATLILGGEAHELPVIEGSEGELAIDIRRLRERTGHITLTDLVPVAVWRVPAFGRLTFASPFSGTLLR